VVKASSSVTVRASVIRILVSARKLTENATANATQGAPLIAKPTAKFRKHNFI
jgi:hypothetical protein